MLGSRLCTGGARGNSTTAGALAFDEAMERNDKLLNKAYGRFPTMEAKAHYYCKKTNARANGMGYVMLYDPAKVPHSPRSHRSPHSPHSHHSHHAHHSHQTISAESRGRCKKILFRRHEKFG